MNTQTAKRFACDRCREQKLKCPRSQPDAVTCERCLRLGAMCVTSIGRPLGRPSTHANNGRAGDIRFLYAVRNGLPPAHDGSQPLDSQQFFQPNSTASATWLDTSNFPTADSASDDSSARASSHVFSDLGVPDLGFDMAEPLSRNLHEPMATEDVQDKAAGPPSSGDPGAYVIGLLGSISLQIAELKDQPWEPWNPHLTKDAFQNGRDMDSPRGRDLKVWNDVLNVMMRFATVLETMNSAPSPALSLTFMLLSTYVQLGELFELIFNRMSRCLREGSGSAAAQQQQQQPTCIQLMMMTQVFEYQMHTVEQLMGLPAEFRVWDRLDGEGEDRSGILGRQDTAEIVRSTMRRTRETFQSIRQASNRIKGSSS
ncbi:Fungal Zn(2)-Cys(6) binuclear cluster domain [Geosmithia morbida]|uniref:Fungal Zn(2)-Cys(6) binuclear cluster domain n=1 Tax=Geosmithia morbida TaxID=1094350 RepID=A0A9P5D5A3_9HYPO|nr:Fungal Zn(2)-Cys(6) binuclear cluster domain [Geosmithia morbida]KAF4124351.1 Fungal Zn(2)-Cys(6) binuclear cluster domain [Geosmithia morbida]